MTPDELPGFRWQYSSGAFHIFIVIWPIDLADPII